MFTDWYETDPDCCQHMRQDGSLYGMIQAVWLDTTEEDRKNGCKEYVVVRGFIDLNDYSEEEQNNAIAMYGYLRKMLFDDFGINGAYDLIAECILEEEILSDSYIVDEADTFEEAKEKIMKIIKRDNEENNYDANRIEFGYVCNYV